eukprot:jgi/Botrbrau1/21145/Bobra.0061s0039.1
MTDTMLECRPESTSCGGEKVSDCVLPLSPSKRHATNSTETCLARFCSKACNTLWHCRFNGRAVDGMGEVTSFAPWSDLPELILSHIFLLLDLSMEDWDEQKRFQTIFSLMGVNREWRALGKAIFFSQLWGLAPFYTHPLQLLTLCPKKITSPFGGKMVRCFVIRDGPVRGPASFMMYMGKQVNPTEWRERRKARLLLTASRSPGGKALKVHFGKNPGNLGLSHLRVSTLGRCLKMEMDRGVPIFGAGEGTVGTSAPSESLWAPAPKPPGLGEVEYITTWRIRRPRNLRVRVAAGQCVESLGPPTGTYTSQVLLHKHCGGKRPRIPRLRLPNADVSHGIPSKPVNCNRDIGDFQRRSSHRGWMRDVFGWRSQKVGQDPENPGLVLVNKPPNWNELLECWCLNFCGRVRMASVKNFQLMDQNDPDQDVVMQFGKVEPDLYTLDFNPHMLSAVQAFGIALSSFDRKGSPYFR